MGTPIRNSQPYSQALGDVISAGEQLLKWLPETREKKQFALDKLAESVARLRTQTLALQESAGGEEQAFFTAAADMRAGYLLVEAGRAVETGDAAGVRAALAELEAEREEVDAGAIEGLYFESDLLDPPDDAVDDAQALQKFKIRAGRTLDNMVTEAADVIKDAVNRIKDKLEAFIGEIGELAKSFSSQGATGIIRSGVESIVSGLKAMAEYLKSDKLGEAIDFLKELVAGGLERVLAAAFGCANTKQTINGLEQTPSRKRQALKEAGTRMAELASRYVLLLKRTRLVIRAIAVAGGLLVLTGVAAHYSALAVPIAYAIVVLATVLIGMTFARSRMPELIAGI